MRVAFGLFDRRLVLEDFPSSDPLFKRGVGDFDDLGYHELMDAGDGLGSQARTKQPLAEYIV
jgi:hypothetical protein